MHQFVRVEFTRFKAFELFRIDLRHFNILVARAMQENQRSSQPSAFWLLRCGALVPKPTIASGPHGKVMGWDVDLKAISIAVALFKLQSSAQLSEYLAPLP